VGGVEFGTALAMHRIRLEAVQAEERESRPV
jgi:hypothetical protein